MREVLAERTQASSHSCACSRRERDSADRIREARDELASAFTDHRPGLYRYFLHRTGDVDRAEDLTQEVFVNVASYLAETDRARPTASLLYSVARRRLVDEIRSAKHRGRYGPLAGQDFRAALGPPVAIDFAHTLRAAVFGLSPSQQRIFVMRFLDGMAYVEIASRLNSSEPACKVACQRARRAVRARLMQAGIGVTDA